MDILISEDIRGKSIDSLREHYDVGVFTDLWKQPAELSRLVGNGVKALIVRNQTKVNSSILDNAASLKVIGRAGVGYDNIDVESANRKGIVVCYTPDGNTVSTAELTLSLMLALLRKIPNADIATKSGKWERFKFLGNELSGKTVGILGLGKIGKAVASRLHAFGVQLYAYDKFVQPGEEIVAKLGIELASLEKTLTNSDIISVHLPLTKETRHLLNDNTFKLMKPGSLLINTARGEIVEESSVVKALQENILKGAALDVRVQEPPVVSELEKFENVILTPHVGALTEEAQEKVVSTLVRDVEFVLSGRPALNYVNFPSYRVPG
ncbi:MAG: hydroxyacid dehydrogenase [Bacteroidota bacterium]|nr:hydroxyacid dehydrogenase [Bacteroidota bacterium]